MSTFLAGRRPLSPGNRAGVGAALVLLAVVSAVESAERPQADFVGLLAAVPFLAAVFAVWQLVLASGVLATVVGAIFVGIAGTQSGVGIAGTPSGMVGLVNLMGIVLATGVAAAGATIRERQADRIAELLKLAAVAQQAVLRPIGPQVGALAISGRYISATAAADIGGDLYEALDTPYGVRIIIGDVRGKGLDAVRLASIVLGSYRHVAYERADLRTIVQDLDRAVARSVGDEDFVTAALVEERGGTLTIVNCGHPAPLLLRRGQVIPLEPPAPAPPLGFMPEVKARVERLEPGDRLLLFTDGLGEARREGEFFPTADRAWRLLGHGTVGDGLASLETALVDWVYGRLEDDIALVLLEYAGPDGGTAVSVPSWEVGAAGS
ncbi:PP2C family protein-serine/threonine phosphatase [Actinoplanes derwentensis]|uniref:Stage II sporulation protein E (SpoIIE) n=1 Tax=Actinoplanes derwentensis TaxID=113562 RepID=A0A1H2CSH5_9ACTN|nr:PP2C family protein-serine/threonine phosphatase [Actinoplanes derwentensis]GID85519.1 membrane protein [Actinoplanes derwentensis]SDT73401.1 Stage II sporulation protein E (SpoIIE) [Actinoplanes derwentensis]